MAVTALRRASGDRSQLKTSYANARMLSKLHDSAALSPTNSFLQGTWCAVMHFHGRAAAETFRRLQPSFFGQWNAPASLHSQVHIIDTPVYNYRYCLLLSFSSPHRPEETTVKQATEDLALYLGLERSRTFVTTPFFITSMCFRPDGDCDRIFKDNVLNPHIRLAIQKQVTAISRPFSHDKVEMQLRQPMDFCLWTRQSNEDGSRARDTIPRQLTTLLSSPVLDKLQPGDNVHIFAEICSSNKHPLSDRRLFNLIPRNKPVALLTVNPDRMTRRSNEVEAVLDALHKSGGSWHTQGLPVGEDGHVTDWIEIDEELKQILKDRLTLGRQRALQRGFYWRRDQAMIRINNFIHRTKSFPDQMLALHSIINFTIEVHGFKRILIIVRVSPTSQAREDDSMNTSLTRQAKFLTNVCSTVAVPVHHLEAAHVSAYHNDFVKMLRKELKALGRQTLILSVGVDRMVRSSTQLPKLKKMVQEDHHGVVSFLWDHETDIDVLNALRFDPNQKDAQEVVAWQDALTEQKRAPSVPITLPLIQPILWLAKEDGPNK